MPFDPHFLSKLGQLKNQIRTRGLELGHHQGLDKLKQMISKYEEILNLMQ